MLRLDNIGYSYAFAPAEKFWPVVAHGAVGRERRAPYRSRHHRSLVAAAARADAAVTGASVAIAAQPVGYPGFERVAHRMMGRMMDRSVLVDLSVGLSLA
jgi:hypothetical protein